MLEEIFNDYQGLCFLKEQPYVLLHSDKAVSDGNFKCDKINMLLEKEGVSLTHSDIDISHYGYKAIKIPYKERFYSESNYAHSLLHETVHYFSEKMGQNSDFRAACYVYYAQNNEVAVIKNILELCQTPEDTAKLDPLTKDVYRGYLKEECKVELAAMFLANKMGIPLDERDYAYTKWNLSTNESHLIAMGDGISSSVKNLTKSSYETEALIMNISEKLGLTNVKDLQNSQPSKEPKIETKSQKDKDRDRER